MSTRIGIVSDVHASPAPLRQALEIFATQGVSDIICAGDIAGYFEQTGSCIELLKQYHCKSIIGNHDQSYLQDNPDLAGSTEFDYLQSLPETIELELEGMRILVVHAEPPSEQHGGIKLLDQQGELIEDRLLIWQEKLGGLDCDVLVVGHTHQVFAQQLGDILVVNPGSSQFNHSCMVLTLPVLQVQIFALEGKSIINSWNFSRLFNQGEGYPRKSRY